MYELAVESQFDSAHNLRRYDGACENLHGHTYRVQVFYQGTELDDRGILVDFKRLKTMLAEVVSYFDHRYLNELPEFQEENPTAENIARMVFGKMRDLMDSGIVKATVWETPTSSASYWESGSRECPPGRDSEQSHHITANKESEWPDQRETS